MTPIFIYDLLIGGINVSDFHIVVFFNDYYTLIVAFLTKQIQNRYRYRRVATPQLEQGHRTEDSLQQSESHMSLYICQLCIFYANTEG